MPTEKDLVVEARELLTGISPLPWSLYGKFATVRDPYSILNGDGAVIAVLRYDSETMEQEDADANAALLIRAPELLRQLCDEVERLRRQVKQMAQDARDDAEGAANEARWQERQGEDYGSY